MDAIIKISSSEFNEEVFKKLKSLISSFGTSDITIAVSNSTENLLRTESKEQYWNRLSKSVTDLEDGKGIVFSMDELEEYLHKIPG